MTELSTGIAADVAEGVPVASNVSSACTGVASKTPHKVSDTMELSGLILLAIGSGDDSLSEIIMVCVEQYFLLQQSVALMVVPERGDCIHIIYKYSAGLGESLHPQDQKN